jgi:hypothetical protein
MRQSLSKKIIIDKIITEAKAFNITFWYVGDVLSINNPNLSILIPFIYSKEIEVKEQKKQLPLTHSISCHVTQWSTFYHTL